MGVQLKKRPGTLATQLDALEQTVAVMRRLGVVSYDGLLLGPEPAKPDTTKKKKPEDVDPALEERRAYYQEVLGRSVSDSELRRLP